MRKLVMVTRGPQPSVQKTILDVAKQEGIKVKVVKLDMRKRFAKDLWAHMTKSCNTKIVVKH